MHRTLRSLPLLLSLPLVLTACDVLDDDDDSNSEARTVASGAVRVTHAGVDAPNVDVYVDGSKVLSDVPWQASSGLIELAAGEHDVRVVALAAAGEIEVFNAPLDIAAGVEYDVTAVGQVADGLLTGSAADGGLEDGFNLAIVTREAKTVEADTVRVQVLHGAQGVPAVDLHVTGVDDALSASTVLDTLAFGQFTDAVEVPAGTYRIRLTVDGDESYTAAFDITTPLAGGADLYITAIPNLGAGSAPVDLLLMDGVVEGGSDAVVVQDSATGSEVRIVHTIADVPEVDIWLNGVEPAVDSPLYNLGFPDVTPADGGYLAVPSGDYDIDVALSGTTNIAISAQAVPLAVGENYTVLAVGEGDGTPAPALLPLVDDPRAIATDARLRVIHASPAAGNVDIYLSADEQISDDDFVLADVPYQAESGYLAVAPGNYSILVTPNGEPDTVALGPLPLTAEAGEIYTAIAVNDPLNETGVAIPGIDVGLIGLDGLK